MGSKPDPKSSSASPSTASKHADRRSVTGKPPLQVRKLVKNLPGAVVIQKIREAGRICGTGKREQGFYLLDANRRQLYLSECKNTSFKQFVRQHTDLDQREANEFVRVAEALEELTAIDDAFNEGLIYWGAVRAIIRIAVKQTEAEWIEFARSHTVRDVERKVAYLKKGDRPGTPPPFQSAPTWFRHEFKASPELHQAIEALMAVLSTVWGHPVTEQEAIQFACQVVLSMEIQADANRAAKGEERKLPSTYRLVIILCEFCRKFMALLPDGPEPISAEAARELIEGAEVVDLRGAEHAGCRKRSVAEILAELQRPSPPVPEGNSPAGATHVCQPEPEVVLPQGFVLEQAEHLRDEAQPTAAADDGDGAASPPADPASGSPGAG